MNTYFPVQFQSFDNWCDYSDNLEHSWKDNSFWARYTPEDWIHLFPEMKDRVSGLLMDTLELKNRLINLYNLTEKTFSTNLNERLFEEASLDCSLGKTITNLEKKINVWRRMLLADSQPIPGAITQEDINQAKQVPMESLIDKPVKKGQMLCLFHEEKTPSCKVYSDHLHCFGCGKTLDTIGYIMETQGKTFINSVKYLCNK